MEPKCEEQIEEPAAAWTLGVPFENQNPFHRELTRSPCLEMDAGIYRNIGNLPCFGH